MSVFSYPPDKGDIDFKSKDLPAALVVIEVVDDEECAYVMQFVWFQK